MLQQSCTMKLNLCRARMESVTARMPDGAPGAGDGHDARRGHRRAVLRHQPRGIGVGRCYLLAGGLGNSGKGRSDGRGHSGGTSPCRCQRRRALPQLPRRSDTISSCARRSVRPRRATSAASIAPPATVAGAAGKRRGRSPGRPTPRANTSATTGWPTCPSIASASTISST